MKQYIYIIFGTILLVFIACESGDINFTRADSESSDPTGFYDGSGQGGSMARFTIVGDYLYAVDDTKLLTFDISSPKDMTMESQLPISWGGIETIFPMGDKLLLGTTTGMHILDISNPDNIKHLSKYEHIVSCDPVVASGNYAYVTLNSKQFRCNIGVNELQIIDISDLTNPKKVKTWVMEGPKGLGVTDSLLFVCDDDDLLVYDRSNPVDLSLIQKISVEGTYDVIPYNNLLILISSEGLKQYSYENNQLTFLSSIDVSK